MEWARKSISDQWNIHSTNTKKGEKNKSLMQISIDSMLFQYNLGSFQLILFWNRKFSLSMSSRLISPLCLLILLFLFVCKAYWLHRLLHRVYLGSVRVCCKHSMLFLLYYSIVWYFLPDYHTTVLFNLCNLDCGKKLVFFTLEVMHAYQR